VETLTVMFTDLVDSTGMRVRLGEERAERVRERHDRLVRAAVVASHGRIAKHTGDGVMAVFMGASDALAAAVAVQQDLDADNRQHREPRSDKELLRVRIGISVGDVTVEGEDCFGLPVVEAQRLEAAAQPGQVIVSGLVSALARGRGGHELRPIGQLELKGLEHPVEAQEVVWHRRPSPSESPALPPGLGDRGAFPFTGRVKEAEALTGAWSAVSTGGTRLVLVSGEPGIGKTRLAAEVAASVADKGGVVLAGRCDELVAVAYQPFAEALRYRMIQPEGTEALGPAPGELIRLVPELADVVDGLASPLSASPDAERLRLFEAVRGWLAAMATTRPIMLVLDDLHWADIGTLLLLRHVVVTDPVPQLLVVGTYRDTDLDRSHPFSGMLGELRRGAEVTRVVLEGLDTGEVTDLMSGAAGHQLENDGRALAGEVRAETGGNPFFVGEVLRHLAETGAIVFADGRWRAARPGEDRLLPEGIGDVVGRRVSALPDATQQALATAAVVGVDFDLAVVARVAGEDEDVLINALERARRANLILETGVDRYRFRHALVRSSLQAELSRSRRARVHRAVAEALELLNKHDLDRVATDLAYHWGQAGPATAHEQAVTYARRAGQLAYERAAPEEAARWYRQARELLDGADPALDAELLWHIGQADAMARASGWQDTLLEAARAAERLGNVALMADALCPTGRTLITAESPELADTAKIELLERALARSGDDPLIRARLAGALAHELLYTGDDERRAVLVASARRDLERVADPVERWRVGRQLSMTTFSAKNDRQGLLQLEDQFRLAARAAEAGEDDYELGQSLVGVFYASLALGRPTRDEVLPRLDLVLARYPHPNVWDLAMTARITAALVDGRTADAESLADLLERESRHRDNGQEMGIFAGMARLEAARERSGLEPLIEFLKSWLLPPGDRSKPTAIPGVIALALAEAGRTQEARVMIDDVGANGFRDIPDDAALPVVECTWAEAAALSGHLRACGALYARMAPRSDTHATTGGWYLGSMARYMGLFASALERPEEADDWFGQAEAAHVALRTPPWLARGQLDWAEALSRRGEDGRARELARQALIAIGDLDLGASRSRAERLLANL
jgi:class 3 adenylate cyclase